MSIVGDCRQLNRRLGAVPPPDTECCSHKGSGLSRTVRVSEPPQPIQLKVCKTKLSGLSLKKHDLLMTRALRFGEKSICE